MAEEYGVYESSQTEYNYYSLRNKRTGKHFSHRSGTLGKWIEVPFTRNHDQLRVILKELTTYAPALLTNLEIVCIKCKNTVTLETVPTDLTLDGELESVTFDKLKES